MSQNILANGKTKKDTDMVYKNGQMEQNMKDIGKMIKPMVKEHFGMFLVIFTKENGKTN